MNGLYDTCTFIDCCLNTEVGAGSYHTYFENCLFMGGTYIDQDDKYTPTTIRIEEMEFMEINAVYYDSKNQKAYIAVYADNYNSNSFIEFLNTINGHAVYIESYEELKLLYDIFKFSSTSDFYQIGLDSTTGCWGNGEPFTLDINVDSMIYGKPVQIANYNYDYSGDLSKLCAGYFSTSTRSFTDYFLIEIDEFPYCETITLFESEVVIDTELTYQIGFSASPTNVDTKDFVFVSEDVSVATVDENGIVTPLREGDVVITIYSPDYRVSETCLIHIKEKVSLEDFDIVVDEEYVHIGDEFDVNIDYYPINTTERNATYCSSDSSVVSIDNFGNAKAISNGTAIITVKLMNIEKTIKIHVVNLIEDIYFKNSSYNTYLGDEDESWQPVILPMDATEVAIEWISSNPNVAYIDENNKLIRVSGGMTSIRAQIKGTNLYADMFVTVSTNSPIESVDVVQISRNHNNFLMTLGDNTAWLMGDYYEIPLKIADNVISSAIVERENGVLKFILVDLEGNVSSRAVKLETRDVYDVKLDYKVDNVKKVVNNYNMFILLRNDNTAMVCGSDNFGSLCLGNVTSVDIPTPIPQKDIIDVLVIDHNEFSATFLLNKNGDVYAYGSQNKYTTPQVLGTNVTSITSDESYAYLHCRDNSVIQVYARYFTTNINYKRGCSFVKENQYISYEWDITPDGKAVASEYFNGDVSGLTNVCKIFPFSYVKPYTYNTYYDFAFIQTADGKLYVLGEGSSIFTMDGANQNLPYRINFGHDDFSEENMNLHILNMNISDGILHDKEIVIEFDNKVTYDGSIYLKDSDGYKLTNQVDIVLGKVIIKPLNTLDDGAEYTLYIPSGALTTQWKTTNSEYIFKFMYKCDDEIVLENSNIRDGDVVYTNTIEAIFDYSFATIGDNFNEISLKKDSSAVSNVEIFLEDSSLRILADLEPGNYSLFVPKGALKDHIGGLNEELVINFVVKETVEIVEHSLLDSSRVDETMPIVFAYVDAIASENFNDIKLFNDNHEVEISLSIRNSILVISHNGLIQGQKYSLVIPEGALQNSNGFSNIETVYEFTTYEPIRMMFSSIANENISLKPTLKLYYNGQFNLDKQKVSLSANGVKETVEVTMVNGVLTISPINLLNENTTYKLVVEEGALTDERGIANELYEVEFKTIDKEERFDWSLENVQPLLEPYNNINLSFYNNAIINNFNNTNVNKWLKLTTLDHSGTRKMISVTQNYWQTTDIELINKQIQDFDDYMTLNDLVIGNYITDIPSHVFPYVTNVRIFNSTGDEVSTVSNETITVRVEFNRDMDITVPLSVRFGSSKPYAEYEISGQYVSARAWEGTYTLKTTIENGNQYFNISNGRAADDHYFQLFETLGRFTFEIDTFAAQAMIMQANPTAEGIQLTWMQDDFDTLAGYNVYRSNAEDGLYTRLNSYVIPADTKEFFDDTIEPGEIYYYNFTVVQTDLTESEPSGKVSVRSFDTMAPNIYHSPVHTAYTGSNLIVNATITDNLKIEEARLYYRVKGTIEWKSIKMYSLNSKYTGVIYADNIDLAGIEYYIKAFDGISYTYKGDSETPYEVTVKLAVDKNSLGDIDGDGTITAKDALMILQAANDKLNLTEEQFMRADLNGDGILSAAEALKILQFVSGKINTLLG